MYQRDQSGHTPQISNYLDNLGDGEAEFELDIEVGHGPGPPAAVVTHPPDPGDKKLRRMDSVYDTSALSQEDVTRLNSCLEHILDIVGETVFG